MNVPWRGANDRDAGMDDGKCAHVVVDGERGEICSPYDRPLCPP